MSKNYTVSCSNVNFSYAKNFKLKIELTDTDIDKKANTSKIKYKVYAHKINDDGGEFSAKHLKYFKLNGDVIKNVTETVTMGDDNNEHTIASGTTAAIKHNDNGTKTVKFTAKFGGQSGQTIGVKAAIEDEEYTLPAIQRYFTEDPVLQKHSKTSTTYTFTWTTKQTCSKVVLYINGTSFTWTGSAKTGTIKATGLNPSTEYDVYIRCTKEDTGTTMNSKTKQYTTFDATKPYIQSYSRTSSSITVTSGCNLSCKNVQYRIAKSGGSYGSWQTGTTFSGLSANTTYTVQVYAENSESGEGGYGTANITTFQTTSPTIWLASRTSSSLTVNSNCNVTTSSVQYRIKKSGGSYGAYQTSNAFSGLSPNTTYEIEVKAIGKESGETGYKSTTATTYQKTTASIALESRTVNSITVTSNCNVAVSRTQYIIRRQDGEWYEMGNWQTSPTFTKLSPNTTYVIQVEKIRSRKWRR